MYVRRLALNHKIAAKSGVNGESNEARGLQRSPGEESVRVAQRTAGWRLACEQRVPECEQRKENRGDESRATTGTGSERTVSPSLIGCRSSALLYSASLLRCSLLAVRLPLASPSPSTRCTATASGSASRPLPASSGPPPPDWPRRQWPCLGSPCLCNFLRFSL